MSRFQNFSTASKHASRLKFRLLIYHTMIVQFIFDSRLAVQIGVIQTVNLSLNSHVNSLCFLSLWVKKQHSWVFLAKCLVWKKHYLWIILAIFSFLVKKHYLWIILAIFSFWVKKNIICESFWQYSVFEWKSIICGLFWQYSVLSEKNIICESFWQYSVFEWKHYLFNFVYSVFE